MCGIAGWVGSSSPDVLPAMLRELKHRGPDGEGTHLAPGVALGMTRLAIIDLATGQQPMANEDGSLWIVFNGEIYNYRELRPPLEARGHHFATRSDTEVILHAFEEDGAACVERLRGMFAFAIWDGRRRRLFVARDRLGKKPLYYWHRPGLFLFASELKALLRHPAVGRALDWEAFHHYLAFGYTPSARSIFEGVAKLPPGHTAVLADGALRLHRYWELPRPPEAPVRLAPAEAARQVRAELREAVRLRLESDVPVGVFLSGGIDSSAVVASMREVTSGPIRTFSIGFGPRSPSYDELPYARAVATRFATEHHEEVLEPDVADLAPTVVGQFDEPFADSSAIPTWVVAQATAASVKVALSGIGGDETFAGYPRYAGVRLSELWRRAPRAVTSLAPRLLASLVRDSDTSRNWPDRVRRFLDGADAPLPDRYIGWTRFFDDDALRELATPALAARLVRDVATGQRTAFARAGEGDPRDGAFRVDLATYLPDDLLVLADRMAMVHSLEVRAPFCDHRLVEWSLGLPPGAKMGGFATKTLLRRAFADVLPRPVLAHAKQGFMIPLGAWLRGPLRPLLDELLAPERVRARGLFAPGVVERLRREHAHGARTHADRLWTLMVAELWMRQHLDAHGPWSLG